MNEHQLVTGSEAGFSGDDQILFALQLIVKLGGTAQMNELYDGFNDRLKRREMTLSQQGQASFRNFINTKAVSAGYVHPYDESNPGWHITPKGRAFVPEKTSLQLDESKIPEILRLVRKKYSEWDSFDNPSFQKDETDYKRKASKKAQSLLSKAALATLLETTDYSEIIRRIQEVARATNLMHLSHPDSGDLRLLNLPDLDEAAFCREFFALLYNAEPTVTRLNRFFALVLRCSIGYP